MAASMLIFDQLLLLITQSSFLSLTFFYRRLPHPNQSMSDLPNPSLFYPTGCLIVTTSCMFQSWECSKWIWSVLWQCILWFCGWNCIFFAWLFKYYGATIITDATLFASTFLGRAAMRFSSASAAVAAVSGDVVTPLPNRLGESESVWHKAPGCAVTTECTC